LLHWRRRHFDYWHFLNHFLPLFHVSFSRAMSFGGLGSLSRRGSSSACARAVFSKMSSNQIRDVIVERT
jgi:hypothetical protein